LPTGDECLGHTCTYNVRLFYCSGHERIFAFNRRGDTLRGGAVAAMLLGGAEVVPLQTRNGYTIDGRRGNVGPDHFLGRCGGAYGASIARIIVLKFNLFAKKKYLKRLFF